MIDFAKLNEERALYKQFLETDIGKLFQAFERTTIEYWRNDNNDRISDKRLRELDEAQRSATKAFRERLMADMGII